jgi:hypothetical protein
VKDEAAPEYWVTDGVLVRRGPGGPVVCTMGDLAQPSLFAGDLTTFQLLDARMVACAPRLVAALEECAHRLETCCHHGGTTAEYSLAAVKGYRDLIAQARAIKPLRPPGRGSHEPG